MAVCFMDPEYAVMTNDKITVYCWTLRGLKYHQVWHVHTSVFVLN